MNDFPPPLSPAPIARPLSAELTRLRDALADRPATLREMIGLLKERAFQLLLMLCALPFLLPVSLPGTSPPLGLAVAIVSFQLARGRPPWLHRWLLDRQLGPGFLTKVVTVTGRVVGLMEKVVRPRLMALTRPRWLVALHYCSIGIAGLALAVPLPIPLTNTFPGWAILFLTLGLLERDGWFVMAGYVMGVVTAIWFALVGGAIHQTLAALWRWLAS